jgi:hypothetical protein
MTERNQNCKYPLGSYSKSNIPSGYKSQLNNKEITAVCFEINIKHKSDQSAECKISVKPGGALKYLMDIEGLNKVYSIIRIFTDPS